MLSLDSASPVILDMVTTTTENGSETSPSQNGKTSSYENLKKKVTFLTRKRNKLFLAALILITLLCDLFYKIFYKEKR